MECSQIMKVPNFIIKIYKKPEISRLQAALGRVNDYFFIRVIVYISFP